jgi:hypothetical protein
VAGRAGGALGKIEKGQTMIEPPTNTLQKIKDYDEAREGVPGEHWLVLGAGLAAWLLTRRHPSALVRALGLLGGTALVGRAASGRDGVSKVLRYLPVGQGIRRY